MIDRNDLEPDISPEELARLGMVSDRLERDRPVPRAAFRGNLARLLAGGHRASAAGSGRWRILVATYSGLGVLLLAVAGIGLAGVGPFGA
jgi:hypothetical protein